MKKQANNFSLVAYSSLAIRFIGSAIQTNAQAVYTNIDPDLIMDTTYSLEFQDIDMNADGINDFTFLRFGYITYNTTWLSYLSLTAIDIMPYIFGEVNAVAGSSRYIFSRGLIIYPYAFTEGDTINSAFQFNNQGFQVLAGKIENELGGIQEYGLWYPELEDHYLGVRFLDPDSCLHYGWIRCTIQDTLTRLIVKDFAYESKCDTPIKAGDMVGDTTTIVSVTETTLEAIVYSFGTSIFIQLPAVHNTQVNVYTLEGQLVYSTKIINNQTTQIQLPTCQGIYLVELLAEQEVLRKKVYLQ